MGIEFIGPRPPRPGVVVEDGPHVLKRDIELLLSLEPIAVGTLHCPQTFNRRRNSPRSLCLFTTIGS